MVLMVSFAGAGSGTLTSPALGRNDQGGVARAQLFSRYQQLALRRFSLQLSQRKRVTR